MKKKNRRGKGERGKGESNKETWRKIFSDTEGKKGGNMDFGRSGRDDKNYW